MRNQMKAIGLLDWDTLHDYFITLHSPGQVLEILQVRVEMDGYDLSESQVIAKTDKSYPIARFGYTATTTLPFLFAHCIEILFTYCYGMYCIKERSYSFPLTKYHRHESCLHAVSR
jgi:hypothetical protein